MEWKWLLLGRAVLVAAFSLTLTAVFPLFNFTYPRLEILGLLPHEQVVIERGNWPISRTARADERGVARFEDVPLGDWRVVSGGDRGLRHLTIRVRERPPGSSSSWRGAMDQPRFRVYFERKR